MHANGDTTTVIGNGHGFIGMNIWKAGIVVCDKHDRLGFSLNQLADVLEQAGHMPHHTRTGTVVTHLLQLLEKTKAGSSDAAPSVAVDESDA